MCNVVTEETTSRWQSKRLRAEPPLVSEPHIS